MPHVTVKMFPGRSREQKQALTERVVRAMQDALGSTRGDISVSIVEIDAGEWEEAGASSEL